MRIATRIGFVAAGVFVIFGGGGLLAVHHLKEVAEATTAAQAKNVARTIAGMATYNAPPTGDGTKPGAQSFRHLQDVLNFTARLSRYDVEVFDTDKRTVADVDQGDIGKPIEPERALPLTQTLQDGVARSFRYVSPEFPEGTRQVVVPIRDARQKIVAALILDYTPLYKESMAAAQSSLETIAGLTLAALVLAIVGGFFVSRAISRPLERLRNAAVALAEGRKGVVVDIDQGGELGELSNTFNQMASTLEANQSVLERANEALRDEIATRMKVEQSLYLHNRAIESSLNAILIIDLTKKTYPVIYVNAAYERITGYSIDEAVGRGSEMLLGSDVEQPELQSLRTAMRQRQNWHGVLRTYRKDGRLFWSELHMAPVREEGGATVHYVAVLNDITAAREQAEQLAFQANYDALTGLANRNLLLDRLGQAISNSSRRGEKVALLFVDLDGFKLINDNLGHDAGDELLRLVAQRLQDSVRESDTVARLGGDEFMLLLTNHGTGDNRGAREHNATGTDVEADITLLVQKLLAAISQPMQIAGHDIRINGSVGISMFPQDGADAETLLKNADIALYRAKELGRNGFQFFTDEMHQRVRHQMELGTSLRLALERGEFELYYQPQVSLHSGIIVGVESLLRWRHPEKGLVGPDTFIDFAEQSGLILPIGEWIMMHACAQNKAWQDAGLPAFPIAVNVSARQCAQQDLVGIVKRALAGSGLAAEYLEIELTESLSMAEPEKSVPLMNRLKDIGVKLAIDDFGTGYSNMSYLKRFPVDRLKLDISFVREITTDAGSLAISDAIITMSHSLGLEVVAEGVETSGQLELLKARECDLIQGYYFSPPLPADKLADLLCEERRLPAGLTGRSPDAPAVIALDDDPQTLAILELHLRAEGYPLLFCRDAEKAFEMLARYEVAVILCDQRMPGMPGVDFLAAVRNMYPDTVRILLSAYEDYSVTREAINAGAVYKFIEKPWRRKQLLQIVGEAFTLYRRRRAASSAEVS